MHTQPGDATRSRTLCTCVSWLDLGRGALCVALWHISGCGRRCCATGSIHSILFYYNIAFSACRTANENACSLLLCYLSFRLFGLCVMNAESIRLYGNQQPSIHSCHHFDLKPANNTPFEQSITLAVNGVAQLLLCFFASLTTYILFCSRLLRSFGYIVVRFQCFGCCSVSTIAEWGGKVLYSVTVGLRLPAMSFHYDCTAKLSDNVEQKQEPKQKWKKKTPNEWKYFAFKSSFDSILGSGRKITNACNMSAQRSALAHSILLLLYYETSNSGCVFEINIFIGFNSHGAAALERKKLHSITSTFEVHTPPRCGWRNFCPRHSLRRHARARS